MELWYAHELQYMLPDSFLPGQFSHQIELINIIYQNPVQALAPKDTVVTS